MVQMSSSTVLMMEWNNSSMLRCWETALIQYVLLTAENSLMYSTGIKMTGQSCVNGLHGRQQSALAFWRCGKLPLSGEFDECTHVSLMEFWNDLSNESTARNKSDNELWNAEVCKICRCLVCPIDISVFRIFFLCILGLPHRFYHHWALSKIDELQRFCRKSKRR